MFSAAEWRAFTQALNDAGYAEGREVLIDLRFADGRQEKLPAIAAELVALNPAVIVTYSTAGVTAVMNASNSTPIVFASAGDPVGSGFIKSYRRPGGRITGVSSVAPGEEAGIEGKMLELVKTTVPAAKRVGVILHTDDPVYPAMSARISRAAAALGLETMTVTVERTEELDRAIAAVASQKIRVLFVPDQVFLDFNHQRISDQALKSRLAVFSLASEDPGAVMVLAVDSVDIFSRVGKLVARILKGESPAEIAVDQPERLALTINLKSAKAVGITVPPSVRLRADKVIE
jgi:putative ABC transport system substrate-binding protein